MTHYETLGVERDATDAQIRIAFKRLARKYHPDKGGDVSAFQAAQKAYEVLSDPARRTQYDLNGKDDIFPYHQAAVEFIAITLPQIVAAPNPLLALKLVRNQKENEIKQQLTTLNTWLKNARHMRDRLILRSGQNNLTEILDAQITAEEAKTTTVYNMLESLKYVAEILERYDYTQPIDFTTSTGGGNAFASQTLYI